ncbi:MAG: UvrD-helicase domain-containing protein [Bacteroidia bacterium]
MPTQSLNPRQLSAITDEAKRILVVAGAGSGKTKSLLQKIEYLVKEKGVPADKILAITFTRNAANEMINRLIVQNDASGFYQHTLETAGYNEETLREFRKNFTQRIPWISQLTMTTFHGLGYQLMRAMGSKVYDNRFHLIIDTKEEKPEDADTAKETTLEVVRRAAEECAAADYDWLLLLRQYLVDYYHKPEKKPVPTNPPTPAEYYYTTLKGDRVRSKSEVYIADWLYRHKIDYVYERPVKGENMLVYPDFYIPEARIYIEHVSDYSKGTSKKEELLRMRGERMSKTFEQEMYESGQISRKLDMILRKRLSNYLAGPVILAVQEAIAPYDKAFQQFCRDIKRTIDFIKVSALNAEECFVKGKAEPHERVSHYYLLLEKIWEAYHRNCKAKSYMDFNDLMLLSNQLLEKHEDVRSALQQRYDYILVDEFQDVNVPQVEMIKKLLKPSTQLFCVGDDWQSIYGFRGSEVKYFIDFRKYFDDAVLHFLNTNYRSTHSIVEAGNEVIRQNKKKIEKEVEAFNKNETDILLYLASSPGEDDVEFLIRKIAELNKAGYSKEEILILYRRTGMYDPFRYELRNSGVEFTARTIHAAKGLEARAVFILGLYKGNGGFPDTWLGDRIYQVIRPQNIEDLKEEERRLFYVALTRAREHLFLISAASAESEFIAELPTAFVKRISIQIEVPGSIKTCNNCGKVSYGDDRFCAGCGEKLG